MAPFATVLSETTCNTMVLRVLWGPGGPRKSRASHRALCLVNSETRNSQSVPSVDV